MAEGFNRHDGQCYQAADYVGGVQAGALRMVNAIPEVCRQGPGLVSTLDLPYTPSTNVIR